MSVIPLLEKKFNISILLELADRPRKFCYLEKKLEINTATLSSRLTYLEEHNWITKKICPLDARCVNYSITSQGEFVAKRIKEIQDQIT